MSEDAIVPPIIVDDSGDIEIYPSEVATLMDLEAIDVNDGVYDVFDSRGYRLKLRTEGYDVYIDGPESDKPQVAELSRRLRAYISRLETTPVGIVNPDKMALSELVHALTL